MAERNSDGRSNPESLARFLDGSVAGAHLADSEERKKPEDESSSKASGCHDCDPPGTGGNQTCPTDPVVSDRCPPGTGKDGKECEPGSFPAGFLEGSLAGAHLAGSMEQERTRDESTAARDLDTDAGACRCSGTGDGDTDPDQTCQPEDRQEASP